MVYKCRFVSVQRIVFESPIFPLGCMMTNFVCKIVMNGSGETLGPGGGSATCAASGGGEDTAFSNSFAVTTALRLQSSE